MSLLAELQAAQTSREGAPAVNPPAAEAKALADAPALDEKLNGTPLPAPENTPEPKPKRGRKAKTTEPEPEYYEILVRETPDSPKCDAIVIQVPSALVRALKG